MRCEVCCVIYDKEPFKEPYSFICTCRERKKLLLDVTTCKVAKLRNMRCRKTRYSAVTSHTGSIKIDRPPGGRTARAMPLSRILFLVL